MFGLCRTSVEDGGPALTQHWVRHCVILCNFVIVGDLMLLVSIFLERNIGLYYSMLFFTNYKILSGVRSNVV